MLKGLQIVLRSIILAMGKMVRQSWSGWWVRMNEASLPNQDSLNFPPPSSASSLLSPMGFQPVGGRRGHGAKQPWLCNSWAQWCGGRWVWETIPCPFLIWALSSFLLAAEGDDSLHTSAWTEALCTRTLSPQQSKKKPTASCSDGEQGDTPSSHPVVLQYPAGSRAQHLQR